LTIIECEECSSEMNSNDYGTDNTCVSCACGNIQIAHIKSTPPTRLKGYITVGYSRSYPNIYEVVDDSDPEPEKKKEQKSVGF